MNIYHNLYMKSFRNEFTKQDPDLNLQKYEDHKKLLLRFWGETAKAKKIPLLSDFLAAIYQYPLVDYTLFEISEGGKKFLYQAHSQSMTQATGIDMTGRYLHEWPEHIFRWGRILFPSACNFGTPVNTLQPTEVLTKEQSIERDIFPLSIDGENVSHLLFLSRKSYRATNGSIAIKPL